jgi:hypothetical protein
MNIHERRYLRVDIRKSLWYSSYEEKDIQVEGAGHLKDIPMTTEGSWGNVFSF